MGQPRQRLCGTIMTDSLSGKKSLASYYIVQDSDNLTTKLYDLPEMPKLKDNEYIMYEYDAETDGIKIVVQQHPESEEQKQARMIMELQAQILELTNANKKAGEQGAGELPKLDEGDIEKKAQDTPSKSTEPDADVKINELLGDESSNTTGEEPPAPPSSVNLENGPELDSEDLGL